MIDTPRGVSRVCAGMAGLIGLLALLEWALGVDVLTRVTPGFSSMRSNAAVAVVSLAVGWWLPRRAAVAAAVFSAAIAAATIGEYVFGADLGIDHLLVRHPTAGVAHPGRMALVTACCLLLLAVSVLSALAGRRPLVQTAALVVVGVSAMTLLGYSYGVPSLYSVNGLSVISLNTAAALLLLGAAVLVSVPASAVWWAWRDVDGAGVMLRRLLPITLLGLPVLGYLVLRGEQVGWYGTDFGQALMVTASAVAVTVMAWKAAVMLARLDVTRQSALHAAQTLAEELEEKVRDRTKQLETEKDALLASEKMARAAERSKDLLLSRISHELKTPLNAVLGFGQLLAVEVTTPEKRDYVARILEGGRHLLTLVDEVISINEVTSGELSLATEPVAVADVVTGALDVVAGLARDRGVEIRAGDAVTCQDFVTGDRQHLTQVLVSILSNAVEYNQPGGTVTITVTHPGPGTITLSVQDTGWGIGLDDQVRLFDPFDRIGAESRGVSGNGLGLPLAKRLTEAMNGTLGIHSTPGTGSTFWLEFPLADPKYQAANVTNYIGFTTTTSGVS